MNTSNLNRPAIYTERKLDATDFAANDDSADGLPMPTRTGTIAAGILVVVGGVLFVVGTWHLVAMLLA